ncbi:hypothetical protein SDC9_187823 [bioreactor metagenome]|uniref:Uncharacterized protein n=1 Tax=bioreactor metagenome TaxID=1076179 RepID=A0A645HMV6_9ZZZZ
MEVLHIHFHRFGGNRFKIIDKDLLNLFVILVGNKSGADLCIGLRWQYRFGTLTGITTPDTAYVEGGSDTRTFIGGVAFLPGDLLDVQ